MKFKINGMPSFDFELTKQQLEILLWLSGTHYDGVCKDASKVGGFLFGWANCKKAKKYGPLRATWREIDICLKILKGWRSLQPRDHIAASKLICSFNGAMTAAENAMKNWSLTEDC